MLERTLPRNSGHELEFVDGPELDAYLDSIVSSVGWVVVYFNSLEDHVADFIRELVLRDPYQDERLDVFLCGLGYSAKARGLVDLYGQLIEAKGTRHFLSDLKGIEDSLFECARRRNEYAHADWIGVREENYVRVKSKSGKTGITDRYRKFDLIQLQKDAEFINQARFSLCDFHEAIYYRQSEPRDGES